MDEIRFEAVRGQIDADALAATLLEAIRGRASRLTALPIPLPAVFAVVFLVAVVASYAGMAYLVFPVAGVVAFLHCIRRSRRSIADQLRQDPMVSGSSTIDLGPGGIVGRYETSRVEETWDRYVEARSLNDHLVLVQPGRSFRLLPWSTLAGDVDRDDALARIRIWMTAGTGTSGLPG